MIKRSKHINEFNQASNQLGLPRPDGHAIKTFDPSIIDGHCLGFRSNCPDIAEKHYKWIRNLVTIKYYLGM